MVNIRKAAMIGCGFVGSSSAFALMQSGIFSEMVMIDVNREKAEGEAMDIAHGLPFARPIRLYAGTYDDIVDAAIIIITAGANQKPDETRLDLIHKNVEIYKTIIPEIAKRNCEGMLLIVSNPVDILTYTALKLSGFPENRVLGSGTVLDTARLKYLIGEHLRSTTAVCMRLSSVNTGTASWQLGQMQTFPVCGSMRSVRCADIIFTRNPRIKFMRK